ncbi:MAG: alpha/beta hydrolase, partial [Proteobacteria bacterium]|nr:alpha/beta hydrolase [Pseudomonadota bacterium]
KRKNKKKKSAVVIVPSMINRSYILDLLPDKSFARWLAESGFDVFLLDWGNPAKDIGLKSMESIVMEGLLPAMHFAAEKSNGEVHAIGYCMGGTLLAAAAAIDPTPLRSAVFLASPWDFHAGDRVLTDHARAGTPAALRMIGADGALPVDWIQSVFAAVNGDRTVKKFAKFAAMDQEGEAARLFVAVEDWLNDGVDLPGEMGRSCLADWFGDNRTGRGTWKIGTRAVDLAAINIPSLVVASARDRLVPAESSLAMAECLPCAAVLKPDIGHIGMMSGHNAEKSVWEPVAGWLDKL